MKFNYNKLRGKIREVLGTEKKAADILGISDVVFSKKLNNKSSLRASQIIKLCEVLNIDREEIGLYFFNTEVQETELC